MLLPVSTSWRCWRCWVFLLYLCDVCGSLAWVLSDNYDVTRPVVAHHISLEAAWPAIEKWGMRYVSCVAEWGNGELIRGNSYIIVAGSDTTHQYLLADDLQTQWKNAVRAPDLSINIAQTQPDYWISRGFTLALATSKVASSSVPIHQIISSTCGAIGGRAQVLSSQITGLTCNKTQPLAMINHKKLAVSAPALLSESDHYKYYSLGGNNHTGTVRPAYSDTFHCHM